MNILRKEIIHTLSYFDFFEYPPKFDEIHTFLSKKVSTDVLQKELEELVEQKIIRQINIKGENTARYTLGEYSISAKNVSFRIKNSQERLKKAQQFVHILSAFPQIKLIGISGSVAMNNADEEADTDMFIITASGRMWTARFLSLFIAHLMGVRRKRKDNNVQNKICLNLFFDESDLSLPKKKHTEYGAHEVLQMKPIVDKLGIYKRFLDANMWINKLFPNAMDIVNNPALPIWQAGLKRRGVFQIKIFSPLGKFLEYLLKNIQLYLINRHKTTETITATQLWFFPDDFEKKLKK